MRPSSSKVYLSSSTSSTTLAPSGTGTAEVASYSVLGSAEKSGAAHGSSGGLVDETADAGAEDCDCPAAVTPHVMKARRGMNIKGRMKKLNTGHQARWN